MFSLCFFPIRLYLVGGHFVGTQNSPTTMTTAHGQKILTRGARGKLVKDSPSQVLADFFRFHLKMSWRETVPLVPGSRKPTIFKMDGNGETTTEFWFIIQFETTTNKRMFEVSGWREKVSRVHKTNDDAHGHYYWELRDNTTLTISDRLPLLEGWMNLTLASFEQSRFLGS